MSTGLVTIKVFPSRLEAEVAKNQLQSFGIDAFVTADDAGGMRPAPFSYAGGAELVVKEGDAQQAKEMLNNL